MSKTQIPTGGIADDAVSEEHIDATVITGSTALAAEPADTDEFLISDAGTIKRIDYSHIKGGGITHATQWRLTSGLSGATDPISSNLETTDTDGFGIIGADMSVSSGIWTFPTTGIWLVKGHGNVYLNGDSRHQHLAIHTTTDNSNYSLAASGYSFLQQTESNTAQNHIDVEFIFDVTNTTNCKCKFAFENITNANATLDAATGASYTWFQFIRLGDT